MKDCQQLIRIRVKDVAADVIYANNDNRSSVLNTVLPLLFKHTNKAVKSDSFQDITCEVQPWKHYLAGRKFRNTEATLFTGESQDQKQENRNILDFLWNTYGKCCMHDRKCRNEKIGGYIIER